MGNTMDWTTTLSGAGVAAYFQPIVATETGRVLGHEALGRYGDGRSLGPFFLSSPPQGSTERERADFVEFKTGIDRTVRTDALRKAAAAGGEGKIFINVTPSLMLGHLRRKAGELPHTIRAARDAGIDPRRVVLEITEEQVDTDPSELLKLVDWYRAEGFLIALDDLGSAGSNLDRIGVFLPDIIKIDYRLLKGSADNRAFRHILDALAKMAERIGSDVLFEGVESTDDLQNALAYGARYLQGYLFAPARKTFAAADDYMETVGRYMDLYYRQRLEQAERSRARAGELLAAAECLSIEETLKEGTPGVLEFDEGALAARLSECGAAEAGVARIYATDLGGKQITANCVVDGETILLDREPLGRRWCCRPYFFDHVERSAGESGRWTVSAPYRDIASGTPVRTLAKRRADDYILFVDFAVSED